MRHAIAAERRLRHDLQPARFDGLSADLTVPVVAALYTVHGLFDSLQFLPFRSQESEIGFGHETDGGLVLFVPGRGQHLLIAIADVALELLLDLLPEAPFPVQQPLFYLSQFLGAHPCHGSVPPRIPAGAVGQSQPYSRKSSSAALRVECFKRLRAFFSICRMRSRETLKARPISSKVCSTSSPIPNRIFMIFSSRAVRVVKIEPVFSPNWDSRMAS